jgi:hypothetical protein
LSRHRIPLGLGNVIEVLGCLAAIALVLEAPYVENIPLAFVAYLLSWGCLVFFPHCLAHFITGRILGVRFSHYFISASPVTRMQLPIISGVMSKLPVLGLKIRPESLKSVNHGARTVMFASGAAASMLLPFLVFVISIGRLPSILVGILLVLSLANLAFDLYYSPKAGDLSRI